MNAVMYGAGNIGRGFIGALLSQAGYEVTFIDVSQPLVDALNKENCYPLRIISGSTYEDMEIQNVRAINGNDQSAVAEAIAEADIMATAVGAKILPYIVSNIAVGLRKRWKSSDAPLDILICENLMDADKALAGLIKAELSPSEQAAFEQRVGLVETSIGRMVPVQTPEMQDGNPLRICVERYGFLPVDKDAFKGSIPKIKNIVPYSPFSFYLKRKLYLHNMSHAVCAYLGIYTGQEHIYEAIADPFIQLIVREAMSESTSALSYEYGVPMQEIHLHCEDLIFRFTNKALGDTCARVGGDPVRKLHETDRLIGAIRLCEKHNINCVGIAIGAAGALHHYLNESEEIQSRTKAANALQALSNTDSNSKIGALILDFYEFFRRGTNPEQLLRHAEIVRKSNMPEIV